MDIFIEMIVYTFIHVCIYRSRNMFIYIYTLMFGKHFISMHLYVFFTHISVHMKNIIFFLFFYFSLVPVLSLPDTVDTVPTGSTNLTSRVDICTLTELANVVEKNTYQHVRGSTVKSIDTTQSKLFIAAIENNILNGEKRKRASSMDILIESSLFLSMTNNDNNINENYSKNDSSDEIESKNMNDKNSNNNNDNNNNYINYTTATTNNNNNNTINHNPSKESSENETESLSDDTDIDLTYSTNKSYTPRDFTPINPSGPFRVNSPAKSTDSKVTDSDNESSNTSKSYDCIGTFYFYINFLHVYI